MSEPTDLLHRLSHLIARLRGPQGCPWDREQEIEDVRGYLLEEAHEVAAAIDRGDWQALCEELGDLQFQLVFVAHLAHEGARFDIDKVVNRIEAKMIARHPHVFGGESLADSDAVRRAWERRKLGEPGDRPALLVGVPDSLPALLGAYRMTQKAAAVGFDWPDHRAVLAKLDEELAELGQELGRSNEADELDGIGSELGDVLFTLANLARHLKVDPEAALARTNAKFRRRVAAMEEELADRGLSLADADTETLEAAWERAKVLVEGESS